MKKKNVNDWSLPYRYVTGAILFIAFLALLIYAAEAVKALVIAAFVAYLINPAVTFLMKRTSLSRAASVNIVYFTSLILFVGAPATFTPIFFDEIKIVAQDILNLSKEISRTLSRPVYVGDMAFHFEQFGESLAHVQDTVLTPLPEQALALLETTSVSVLWFLVIIVSVYLFLSEWPRIRDGLVEFGPPAYHDDMRELYTRVCRVWMAY
ncbi:MAG: AI-2E family transporter, partial [Anaerolineales bacterium]|nr:AI-2E family transporter [Anaerolineales bacterium]